MENNQNATTVDPFEAYRKLRDIYLDGMSKVMIDAVNSEDYAQTTGALLNNYLTLSAPFREALDKAMVMALEQFSLPSRQQITSLAERFTNLEMRLDDIDAKLDRIVESSIPAKPPVNVESSIPAQPAANVESSIPAKPPANSEHPGKNATKVRHSARSRK